MTDVETRKGRLSFKKLLPLLVLMTGLVVFFASGLNEYLSFEQLKTHRGALVGWVDEFGMLAVLVYVLLYAVVVAFSLPGGAVMTITGGFLFGALAATGAVVIGATVGATVIFLAARTAFADFFHAKAGPAVQKMEAGFQDNALSYLLVLRLIPLFPFFIVNLVPALLGVPLGTYVLGTFFGIIPGTFVYASVGAGLGALFEAGQTPDLGIIFQPEILTPIVGLAVLALLPVAYKKWKASRGDRN